ncbi:MAG: ATP-binding protein [Candidatus Omnitrophota bacterium]|nr:ATP-binding protein [Candidatus Omnitrophota bacterium]
MIIVYFIVRELNMFFGRKKKVFEVNSQASNLLLDAVAYPVVIIDLNSLILTCNQALAELLGYAREDMTGKPFDFILSAQETNSSDIIRDIRRGSFKDRDVYFENKAGKNISVIFSARLLTYGQNVRSIVGVARDVRRAVEYMEQVSIYRNTLARKTKELEKANVELGKTQEQLIQTEKLAVVGQLSYGLAHEIKNPLGIILQGVGVLEKEISPDNQQQLETLDIVKKAVFRSDKIIRSLFDFSKKKSLELKLQDINKVIDFSIELTQHQLKAGSINIVKDYTKVLQVYIDEDQMKQVFVNIILNAVQAMPAGGRLRFKTFIQKSTKLGDGAGRRTSDIFKFGEKVVVVEVEDTGIGISEDNLRKIFDPFFTSKRPGKGMGLGLSITQSIIDNHQGLIRIESEQGKGTKVIIALSAITDKKGR